MRAYVKRMLSEGDGEPSLRRHLCLYAFIFGCGLCVGGLWRDIGPGTRELATVIVLSAFGAVGVGRFAEALDSKNGKGGGE